MNTLKNLQFNTSAATGAGEPSSFGSNLAKLLMVGADATTSILKQKKANENAEERRKNKTEAENKEADFIDALEHNTRYKQWNNDNDYVNMTSDERRVSDSEFDLEGVPDYRTALYKAKYRQDIASRDLGHDTLMQEENKIASFRISNDLISDNLGVKDIEFDDSGDEDNVAFSSEEQIKEMYENVKATNKDITYKGFLALFQNKVFDEISNNPGKFSNMTADETEEYFSSMSVIKDKKLRSKFNEYLNGKRVTDIVNSGLHMDGDAIRKAADKSGVPVFKVWDDARQMNESRVPVLLKGSIEDVTKAVSIYEDYGMDEKVFHTAVKSAINRGDLNLYYNIRNKVMMSDKIIASVSGYEFLAEKFNIDISTQEGIEQAKIIERDTAGAEFKPTVKERSSIYDGLSLSEKSFYMKNEAMASRFAGDADDLENILEDMFKKQSVSGTPLKEVGITNDEQKNIVIDYIRRTANGQKKAVIDLSGTGYMITKQDDNGNDVIEFKDVDNMKMFIADAYEFNDANKAADAIVSGDMKHLSRRVTKDIKVVENMIARTRSEVFKKFKGKLTSNEEKILEVMIRNKYSDEVKNIKNRNSKTLFQSALDTADKAITPTGNRGFNEVKEAFRTWTDVLFGTDLRVREEIRKSKETKEAMEIKEEQRAAKYDNIEKEFIDRYTEYSTYEEFNKSTDGLFYDENTSQWYYQELPYPNAPIRVLDMDVPEKGN